MTWLSAPALEVSLVPLPAGKVSPCPLSHTRAIVQGYQQRLQGALSVQSRRPGCPPPVSRGRHISLRASGGPENQELFLS